MKRILFLALAFGLCAPALSQREVSGYAAASYSITNTPLKDSDAAAYAMVEGGVMVDNVSIGLGVGKSSLAGGDVFVEPKTSVILVEKGLARGYFTLGAGVIASDDPVFFVEYGAGVLFRVSGPIDLALQYSNWAGYNYVTGGVCVAF